MQLFWGAMNHTHIKQQTWEKLHEFWVFHLPAVPHYLPLLGPSFSLRQNNTEIRPINNPTVASKSSSERKPGKFLTLNQKARND